MKIRVLPYLQKIDGLRLTLSEDKRKMLNDIISKRYGNVKRFCEQQNLNYDTVNRWLTLSDFRKREPSFNFLNCFLKNFL